MIGRRHGRDLPAIHFLSTVDRFSLSDVISQTEDGRTNKRKTRMFENQATHVVDAL